MTTTPLAVVSQYIDGFNRGDVQAMAAVFASPGSILDGMAPHVWYGPTVAQDWYRDVLAEGQLHNASGYQVVLAAPLQDTVTGDSAYLVIPATMTFEVAGTRMTQTGALFTVALRKFAEGWRMTAWCWSKGSQ